jgi:hypothetical protein
VDLVAMPDRRDACFLDEDDPIEDLILRRQYSAGVNGGCRHESNMLPEVADKITAEPCILFLLRYNRVERIA